MANTCSLTNKGLVTALNAGTCLVKVQTYNKKYSAVCRITVVADSSTPSYGWSTNEDNISLHYTGGNHLVHSHSVDGDAYQYNSIELESSGRWTVTVDASWVHSTNTWSGNSAVSEHNIDFSVDENNTNSSRVATFTGTNLDTNDTARYTLTQEVKTEQSSIKLFIYEGNGTSNDRTNGNINIGDNSNTQQITVVPKIYSNGTWSNYTFNWGGTITSSQNFVTAISPNLNGTLAQFNSSKLLTFSFLEQRESNANVVVQFKSSTTTPNQALSTITFSLYKNISDLDGNMDIRIFYNGNELTSFDQISKNGEEITITIKTYHHTNGSWVEDDYSSWGASLTSYDNYSTDPVCTPQLGSGLQQFSGSKTLTITFYPNIYTARRAFRFRLFSVEDGSNYFGGMKDYAIYQEAGDGNYYANPSFQNTPNGSTINPRMTDRYTHVINITIPINTSVEFNMKLNTNICGQPVIYENELDPEDGYLKYNGANYSNSNNNYVPNSNDTDALKTFTISLNATNNEVVLKTLSLTITTLTNETYYINISISHGIELPSYYLETDVAVLTELNGEDITIIYAFNINSNIMWQISWPDIVTSPYGSASLLVSGENNSEISFSLKQNTTGSTRTADIVIIPDINSPDYNLYSDIQPVTITLSQNPARTLTINKSEINIPQISGSTVYSFTISSNTNWEIVWVDSWLLDENGGTNLTTQGNGNSTINFRVADNSINSRTTLVTVKTPDNYITRTLSVIQAGENQTPEYKISLVSNTAQSDLGPAYTINVSPETYSCTIYFTCSLIKKTTDINKSSTDWYSSNPTNYLYIKQNNLNDITISQYDITNSNTVTGSFTEQLNTIKGNGIIATTTIPEYNLELTSNVLRVGRVYNSILAGVIHSSDIFIYENQTTNGQLENIVLGANIEYNNPNADINGEVTIYYATDISSFTANITITDTNSGWLFFMATERLNITASKGSNNNNIVFEPIPMSLSTSGDSLQKVYFYITGASVNNSNLLDMQGYQNSYADNYTIFVNKS